LEQFFDEGISIDMVRKKIAKQTLQQGFASRSRWILQILGLRFGVLFSGGVGRPSGQEKSETKFMISGFYRKRRVSVR
jgi:hypothetical protein